MFTTFLTRKILHAAFVAYLLSANPLTYGAARVAPRQREPCRTNALPHISPNRDTQDLS